MTSDVVKVSKEGFGTGSISQIDFTADRLMANHTRIQVAWDSPFVSGVSTGWYSPSELEFIKVTTENYEEHLKQALDILEELVDNIECRGLENVGEGWPELLVTYYHAVKVLS